ncbi:thiamine phosphate synthase [Chryseobacterium indologenes]|uniref:Thiamine phosphate pyrophosphorylase n=1 Tax=Chryseobacterium indologenes TaxID=253 RepID=A0A0N1KT82_CHRID|nr:thiamine phosphate synthase [Chryseobacterium indologenes]KPE51377.1 thiamine phosphate pyrophosphorylase [Chryseobacterium indologenes]
MIIVITPELTVPDETDMVSQLFRKGLDLLHIRKPFISRNEMTDFLDGIDAAFYSQMVLHSHYELADEYNISRFHFREEMRLNGEYKAYIGKGILSTSVHDIETYNTLDKDWEYAFISPVFPSISKKGYGENTKVIHEISCRNNPDLKLVALGGINEKNIKEVLDYGVDGVALLGGIWESDDPVQAFEKCRRNALL